MAGKSFEDITESVLKAIEQIVAKNGVSDYELKFEPVSIAGDNSYGLVLKIEVLSTKRKPFYLIVKLSPKNEARRKQMKVVDYYAREVFMYENVLTEYSKLQKHWGVVEECIFTPGPEMLFSSLTLGDEFIIFEDLQESGYLRFDRRSPLPYKITALAVEKLAKFHAMSFILRNKKPNLFEKIIESIRRDNLFTDDMDDITVEFGKMYIRKTVNMIEAQDISSKPKLIKNLNYIFDNFKEICLKMVNPRVAEPFTVICHGDFWNNNILYQYNESGSPVSAKILDFQVSRYASPVLDFVHYIFTCTEKDLRDQHFNDLKRIYYAGLSDQLKLFDLSPDVVFPYSVFEQHLKTFGVYGFCMSVYSIPFFISTSNEIPDFDKAAEAVQDLGVSSDDSASTTTELEREKAIDFLNKLELLNERTVPIFKQRMTDIVLDLEKQGMLNFVSS